jgi:outer membrane receptor protein involved in Fe transport
LKSIPSDNIKSIEVITTPPAKYDAEGNSGIVNIVLKKAKQDSWSAALRSTYRQSTYPTGAWGGQFNYQKNKIALSSSVNYVRGSFQQIETNKIYYPQTLWSEDDKRRNFTNSISGRLGIDYNFTDKLTIGVQYLGAYGKPNTKDNGISRFINNNTQVLDSLQKTNALNDRKINSHSFNFHTIYKMDTLGKKLSLDFDYFNFKINQDRTYEAYAYLDENLSPIKNSFLSTNDIGNQYIKNYAINIDMEHPLKFLNLNYGGKISFSNTNNQLINNILTTGAPVFNPLQSNDFSYKENYQALYFSADKKIGTKWEFKAGLRMENTQTESNSITLNKITEKQYVKFFPTMYIVYTPIENHSFSLNYGKRISRPSFSWLNPFRWYLNPYSYSEGNPDLQPSYSHNLEFSHSYKDLITTTLYYSYDGNQFGQIDFVDDKTKIKSNIPYNYYKLHSMGINENVSFRKIKWMENYIYLGFYYQKVISDYDFVKTDDGFSGLIATNNIFKINKTLSYEISYWYSFSGNLLGGIEQGSASSLNMGFRTSLLEKKLQLAVSVNDIFKTSQRPLKETVNNINIKFRNYYDNRYFRLSLTYNFGGNIKPNQRDFGNQEEKDRVN